MACRDPLNISQRRAALEVKEDPTRGICVPELLYAPVDDWQAVMQLVATGESWDTLALPHAEGSPECEALFMGISCQPGIMVMQQ